MRSISAMSCMIWTRNSSRHILHTPLPQIHYHCVIKYPGRPTNAISLLLFSSFIVVMGAFCWGGFFLFCCGVVMGISGRTDSFLTASFLKRHKRVFDARYMDWTTNPDSSSGWFNALCCLSLAWRSRNKNMVWISAAFSFADRIGDEDLYFTSGVWFYRLFYTVFLYLGWLSVVFHVIYCFMLMSTCYMRVRWPEVSRHVFHLSSAKKRRPSHFSKFLLFLFFFWLYARCPCLLFVHVLDIKPGRLSD